MTWQNLPPINLTQGGLYVPIPLAGAGGRVPLQIPAFAVGERGLYEVGIYDLPSGGPPGLVAAAQTAQIAPFTRSLVFEVPPAIAAPHVGIRLLSHEDLETATYSVAVRWQPPYGSGTGNGGDTPVPSGFVAAISWQEIKAAAISEIAQGYATVESVATQLAEIQEAIDALSTNTATQQAIAAITTRIQALESSDTGQASAITALQQSISALAAAGATDAELAAGLAAIQSQLADLASDSELSGAIAPIQAALDGLGGTYATDAELAAAILPLATKTELTNAIASLRFPRKTRKSGNATDLSRIEINDIGKLHNVKFTIAFNAWKAFNETGFLLPPSANGTLICGIGQVTGENNQPLTITKSFPKNQYIGSEDGFTEAGLFTFEFGDIIPVPTLIVGASNFYSIAIYWQFLFSGEFHLEFTTHGLYEAMVEYSL